MIIAFNDSWVMSAWGKVNGVTKDSKILFMSDTKTKFSEQIGWMAGMGERNGRWAMIIEKDGKISYAETEKSPREVTVSNQYRADSALGGVDVCCRRFLVRMRFCRSCRCTLCMRDNGFHSTIDARHRTRAAVWPVATGSLAWIAPSQFGTLLLKAEPDTLVF